MGLWGIGSEVQVAGEGVKAALDSVGGLAKSIRTAITGVDPEKQAEIEKMLVEAEGKARQAQTEIIMAEAQGQSWMQRNWRPLLMMVIIIIVANNFIIYPYMSIFTDKVKVLDLPDKLWTLMEIGVGGYILGRTAEKTMGRE